LTKVEDNQREDAPVFFVQGGNFAWKQSSVPSDRLGQQRLKAELQLRSFGQAGTDAVALASGDLSMGVDWMQAMGAEVGLPLVATNLDCGEKKFSRKHVVEKGGVRLGVLSLIQPGTETEGCTVTEPDAALASAMDEDVQLWLLSGELPQDQLEELSQRFAIDIVLDSLRGLQLPDPTSLPSSGLLIGAGRRGKHLGVASIYLAEGASGFRVRGAEKPLREELAQKQKRLEEVKRKLADAQSGKRERLAGQVVFYEAAISETENKIIALAEDNSPRHGIVNSLEALSRSVTDNAAGATLLSGFKQRIDDLENETDVVQYSGPFVGSQACMGCHEAAYAQWSGTRHSVAWKTLEAENRTADLDCFSCHATGVFHAEGPKHPSALGSLTSVGCEECHGPGKEHLVAPKAGQMSKKPDISLCLQCHDGVRDEGRFDAAVYYPKVMHESSGN
jgi:hypothetical protein